MLQEIIVEEIWGMLIETKILESFTGFEHARGGMVRREEDPKKWRQQVHAERELGEKTVHCCLGCKFNPGIFFSCHFIPPHVIYSGRYTYAT